MSSAIDDAEEGGRRLKEEANGRARRHRRQARVAPRSIPPLPTGRRSLLMLSWYHDILLLLVRIRELLPVLQALVWRPSIRSERGGLEMGGRVCEGGETQRGSDSIAHSNPPRQTPTQVCTMWQDLGDDETYRAATRDERG